MYLAVSLADRKLTAATTALPANRAGAAGDPVIGKEEADISVAVRYLLERSTGRTMVFDIAPNTHTVSLDGSDFHKTDGF